MDAPVSSDISPTSPAPAKAGEELIFLFCVFWVMVGLCLDGWAHRYQPELESFFTPWHAVFYTGFIAGTAWVAFMIYRRRATVSSLRAAIPDGYQLAIVGLGVFAVGGIGDGFWHTIFGVEVGLDALLSPTHLLLLVGMLAAATAPIRAAWRRPPTATALGFTAFLPVTLSLAASTTGVAFFFLYANGFSNWPMTRGYQPGYDEALASLGIYSFLATTAILLFSVMFVLRRWQPPFGVFTTIFTTVGIFMSGLDAFQSSWQILAPIVGGLVTDIVVGIPFASQKQPADSARAKAIVCGTVTPLAMWSVSTAAHHLAWGIQWPPELWLGSIVMASLVGMAMALLAHPARWPSPSN